MSDEPNGDPYDAVLADLRAKRDQLDIAISAIEAVREGRPGVAAAPQKEAETAPAAALDGGAFLSLSIVDATKKLLGIRRKALNNPTITAELRAGGLVLRSNDPVNTIGAVLTRRSKEVGDIVWVSRGTWGLREWYPHTNFRQKKDDPANRDPSEKAEALPPQAHADARPPE